MNKEQPIAPLKAIKKFCRSQCCVDDMEAWKNCLITECLLYPFRMGKNPFRKKRVLTDEERKKIGKRLQKSRDDDTNDKMV